MTFDPNDYISRAQNAPSTPFGGGGGGFGGGGSSASAPERFVYYGAKGTPGRVVTQPSRPAPRRRATGLAMRVEGDSTPKRSREETRPGISWEVRERPESEAREQVTEWFGTEDFNKWGDYLLGLGLVDENDSRNFEALDNAWKEAAALSARMWSRGKQVSPWQAARILAGGGGAGGSGGSGSPRYGTADPFTGSRVSRSTSRNVDLSDPMTAKAIVNDVLSNALGRAATPEELEAFRSTLNAAERENPSITESTTTSNFDDGVEVSSSTSSTTSGGITAAGRQQVLQDEAMAKPEYGAYQAAATYFNALLGSLGTVGGN